MNFKNAKVFSRFLKCRPVLQFIAADMATWCEANKLHFVITESLTTIEEDQDLNRVSSTHREGRALDIRSKDWPREWINFFGEYFIEKYKSVAALNKFGTPILIVWHNSGHGEHFHVQIRRGV